MILRMVKLTKGEVSHIAKLAKLLISDDETKKFQKELVDVISYIDELSMVDTKSLTGSSRATNLINVLRSDEVSPARYISPDESLKEAPKSHNNFFAVALIIKTKDVKD